MAFSHSENQFLEKTNQHVKVFTQLNKLSNNIGSSMKNSASSPIGENLKKIHSFKLNVRINDLNYGNHLAFNSLAGMLQEANVSWLKSMNKEATELNIQDNIGWVMKELNIKFLSETFYDQTLIFDLYIKNSRKTSISIQYEIYNESADNNTAIAFCELAFVNTNETQKKISKVPRIILDNIL